MLQRQRCSERSFHPGEIKKKRKLGVDMNYSKGWESDAGSEEGLKLQPEGGGLEVHFDFCFPLPVPYGMGSCDWQTLADCLFCKCSLI